MVLHPGQHATQGGVLAAVSRIAWESESSLVGCRELWGVSLDFEKMFNMLSGLISADVATYMGLSAANIMNLLLPLLSAVGVWNLPHGAAATPFANVRGLPQGMASSVLFAELAISPIIWRVARALPQVLICAYVDDLNFVSANRENLLRVVRMVREFADHFSLSLSDAKTKVWTTKCEDHENLSRDTGFTVEKSLCALGGEWPVSRGAEPQHVKELARLDECRRRLTRARTLPIPAPKLALIVSTGCLSLLDFLNLPDPKPYLKLRSLVKEVFDIRAAAPEVLMSILVQGTLDPQLRWLMSILRLWFMALQDGLPKEDVDELIEQAKGRLGKGAVQAFRWGITVSCEGFSVGPQWVPLREPWFVVRKVLMRHLKREQARRLADRRPLLYAGLEGWNHKQHNRLLMSVSPYERKVLLKLWSGAAMCQHKRGQVYGESTVCACGCEDQTLRHLLWECPCVPPPPPSIEFRRHLPNSQSVAHLLPLMAERADITAWKQSCVRAVRVLAMNPNAKSAVQVQVDTKGHDVAINDTGSYAFCRKCFVTRRIKG